MSFVQHSVGRVDADVRGTLVPLVIRGIARDAADKTTPVLYNVLLQLLPDLRMPSRGSREDDDFRERAGLSDPEDAKFIAYWLGRTVILKAQAPGTGSDRTLAALNPALTAQDMEFLRPERPESVKVYSNLPVLRRKLVEFLASGAFKDDERFIPTIIASASADSRVSSVAIDSVKRSDVSLEDEGVVKALYALHNAMTADIRTRVLDRLSRSEIATTKRDEIAAVVELDFMPAASSAESSQSSAAGIDPRLLLQPASNLERTKLHKALFQFLVWVGKVGPTKGDFAIGNLLITKMIGFLEESGWPTPNKSSLTADERTLRGVAYETLGLVARGSKLAAQDRFLLSGKLFRALAEDPIVEVVVNIDAALSSLIRVFSVESTDGTTGNFLRMMLLDYMMKDDGEGQIRSTRHMAVKWANQCLPFSDKTARWMDILAIAGRTDERRDVIDEGQKGLDPWTYYAHTEEKIKLPSWTEMSTMFFASQISPAVLSEEWLHGVSPKDAVANAVFTNFRQDRIRAFPIALEYCKQMMLLAGLSDFKVEADWKRRLEALLQTDNAMRDQIRQYLVSVENPYIVLLLQACLDGTVSGNKLIIEDCAATLVELLSLSPASAVGYVANRAGELVPLLKSNKREIRHLAAKAFGILVSHPSNSDEVVTGALKQLLSLVEAAKSGSRQEAIALDGLYLSWAHLASRAVYYGRAGLFGGLDFPYDLLATDSDRAIREAGTDALAQLWTARLAVPSESTKTPLTKVVELLVQPAKQANEKAISALGRLALALPSDETKGAVETDAAWKKGDVGNILEELFKLHEIKQAEVHFTVGEAITAAIAGWDSSFVQLTLDVDTSVSSFRTQKNAPLVTAVLDKLFVDSKQTKPSLLKASGIWLFCIVQYCAHLPEVQNRLREAQAAFMRLLNARDELVQETASRGL